MLTLAAGVQAQSHRAAIRGQVVDASGAVIAAAAVTAVNEATNETRSTTSSESGAFALAELAPGTWRVEIGAPGHKTQVQRVVLAVNQELRADAQLQVGALTDRVEVSAPIADLRRDSSAIGTVVENRQILDMPLDGRNFLELTLLAPGAVPAAQGSAGSVRGDFSFSVNGGREDFNSFLLDGADNIDPKLNTAGVQAAGRRDPGIRGAHEHARSRARPAGRVAGERGDEIGHESAARYCVHVLP